MKFFFRYVLTDLRRCVRGGLWCAGIIGVTFFLFFSLENMGILNDNVVSAYLFFHKYVRRADFFRVLRASIRYGIQRGSGA